MASVTTSFLVCGPVSRQCQASFYCFFFCILHWPALTWLMAFAQRCGGGSGPKPSLTPTEFPETLSQNSASSGSRSHGHRFEMQTRWGQSDQVSLPGWHLQMFRNELEPWLACQLYLGQVRQPASSSPPKETLQQAPLAPRPFWL